MDEADGTLAEPEHRRRPGGSRRPGSGGQALFAFVRFWSRRWTGVGAGVRAERGQDVMGVLRTLTADWPGENVRTLLTLMDRLVRAQVRIDAAGGP